LGKIAADDVGMSHVSGSVDGAGSGSVMASYKEGDVAGEVRV